MQGFPRRDSLHPAVVQSSIQRTEHLLHKLLQYFELAAYGDRQPVQKAFPWIFRTSYIPGKDPPCTGDGHQTQSAPSVHLTSIPLTLERDGIHSVAHNHLSNLIYVSFYPLIRFARVAAPSRILAVMASSSQTCRTLSFISTLPLPIVVTTFRPVMPNKIWPLLLSAVSGVGGL